MTSDGPAPGRGRTRPAGPAVAVAAGAGLYVVLGFLPWASVTLDVLGRISASGYRLSVLVPLAAGLLVAGACWAVLPAVREVPVAFPRSAVTLGLAATAFLLTLVTWLRTTDYGFEAVPLLALLVTGGVAAAAAGSLVAELRAPAGTDGPAAPR